MTVGPAPDAGAGPSARRLGRGPMLAYGVGAVAYGVKDTGFGTFLLLFYNQRLGLPAQTVGLVVMVALLLDAMIDPAIGLLSDRTRGRWGRRHPWMYGAALPIMVGWWLIWNPPALSQPLTLAWLFATAVLVRSAVSAYEVPSQALSPELTADYDERTRIMAYRYLFGWAGGLTMLMAAFFVFLAPSPALAPRSGYAAFAAVGAAVMGVAILTSALGTHREIARLPRADAARQTLRRTLTELRQTVRNRAFAVLMLASVCAYINQGIVYALANYFYIYVWGVSGLALVWITLALFTGVATAFVVAPRIGRRGGKPRAAAVAALAAAAVQTTPYWLRLAGAFPVPGSPALLPLLLCFYAAGTACSVTAFILAASMMADVVEDSQVRTGRRSEGVFFAGSFFVQKCTSGIGIFGAGAILALAGFPDKARPGHVPLVVLDRLTIIFACLYFALALAAACFFVRFPFGRGEHQARLARLAAADDRAPGAPVYEPM